MAGDITWGAPEVKEHLEKVRKHFGYAPDVQISMLELARLLEAYDAEFPITQEQANAVSAGVIAAYRSEEARQRGTDLVRRTLDRLTEGASQYLKDVAEGRVQPPV